MRRTKRVLPLEIESIYGNIYGNSIVVYVSRISIRSISILFDKSIGFCIPIGGTVVWSG